MNTKTKSKWKNSRKLCSAINCNNYQFNSQHLAFHRFPENPDRCARWVQNLGNASLQRISSQQLHQSYRVCSEHFDLNQFKRPSNVHAGLKWNAVPTKVNALKPPSLLGMKLRRKTPMKHQESPRIPLQSVVMDDHNYVTAACGGVETDPLWEPADPGVTAGTGHIVTHMVVCYKDKKSA